MAVDIGAIGDGNGVDGGTGTEQGDGLGGAAIAFQAARVKPRRGVRRIGWGGQEGAGGVVGEIVAIVDLGPTKSGAVSCGAVGDYGVLDRQRARAVDAPAVRLLAKVVNCGIAGEGRGVDREGAGVFVVNATADIGRIAGESAVVEREHGTVIFNAAAVSSGIVGENGVGEHNAKSGEVPRP